MARRKRADPLLSAMPQLMGLAVLLCLINPAARQAIVGFGMFFVIIAVFLAFVLVSVGVYRLKTRRGPSWAGYTANPFAPMRDILSTLKTDRVASPPNCSSIPTTVSVAPLARKPSSTTELVEQLRSIDWFQFEKVVALTYRKQGYDVSAPAGAHPDGGIDLRIGKDGETSAVQCKHWRTRDVGVRHLREFLGALEDAKISRGIFVTLCGYKAGAKQLADRNGIRIVNETGLANMLEAVDARFDPEILEILRDRRKFCPKCEREMVLRTHGRTGEEFWGCVSYPKCRYTMSV
jgi:hypothetical protein